jgi:ketosteroid isomerase-like protein
MMTRTDNDFSKFVGTCREAVAQQVGGRTEAFQSLWSRSEDVVLIGAAGSHQTGWHDVSARLSWASQHLNFGGFHVESLLASVSGDLAFTVDLEHMSREVDGKTENRTLRSSQGYRLENGQWRVVFRHGDPMAEDSLPT